MPSSIRAKEKNEARCCGAGEAARAALSGSDVSAYSKCLPEIAKRSTDQLVNMRERDNRTHPEKAGHKSAV
jgi:hypothetical protein